MLNSTYAGISCLRSLAIAALFAISLALCCARAQAVGFRTVYTFNAYCDGHYPSDALLHARDGKFYGATTFGGTNGEGTIFQMTASGSVTTIHSFTDANGDGFPSGYIIEGSDGNLYGTTSGVLNSSVGSIWKITLPDLVYSSLYTFSSAASGLYQPSTGLVEDGSGSIYGICAAGGNSGGGGIFKFNLATKTFTDLNNFFNLSWSYTPPVLIGSTLYGVSFQGGANNAGAIYSVDTDGAGLSKLYSFTNANGNIGFSPVGLMAGADGNLYGVANEGGSFGFGTLFKMSPTAKSPVAIHNFSNGADGSSPVGVPIQGSNGVLYGASTFGGVVWSVHTNGTNFTVLSTLPDSGVDGGFMTGGVAFGGGGSLYGICTEGGTDSYGTVFKTATAGANPTLLRSFGDGRFDGVGPRLGALVLGPDGNYYGTTSGDNGVVFGGTLYQLTPSFQETVVHYFDDTRRYDNDGANPTCGPILGPNGDLVGTTTGGGGGMVGAIYDYNTTTGTLTTLLNFLGIRGEHPNGNMLLGSNGRLYVTAEQGGEYDWGALLSLGPDGSEVRLLHSFFKAPSGIGPEGNFVQTKDGAIYGTCSGGGGYGCGSLWTWSASAGYRVLRDFDNNIDGSHPTGLTLGVDGNLYGTLFYSGTKDGGLLYRISPTGTGFTVLHTFTAATDGSGPPNTVLEDSPGVFYGTCENGGPGGYGTVWQYRVSGNRFKLLHSFTNNGADGGDPMGMLMEGKDGNLYGTTAIGGVSPYPGTAIGGSIYQIVAPSD